MPDIGSAPPRPDRSVASGLPAEGALDHVEAWIFDLDNTLYPASCNLFAQVDARMNAFIQRFLSVDATEAHRIQKQYFREYGTTLRGLMIRHGLAPAEFLEYVHAIDCSPVQPSPALDAALGRLPGRKVIFTNGSVRHAENVIARLGVGHHFHGIFDIIAMDYVPKPDPSCYANLVARHDIDPRAAAMFEDLPRNLAPAAALGMTTVLVRTDAEWAQDGADGDHIDYVTDDLVGWLEAAAATRRG
mgnify:CR=1 FL=1|jgi:putative hydrolase of the HAD superfamily